MHLLWSRRAGILVPPQALGIAAFEESICVTETSLHPLNMTSDVSVSSQLQVVGVPG